MRWLDQVATPRRILVAGWLLFLIYAYPGYLSPDPIQQLWEARTGYYSDWHPPMMGFLWKLEEHVIAGTFGMLLFQSLAMWLGLSRILRVVVSPRAAAILTVAILLFPPVLTPMAVIWKDSQMAGYLMAGIACLLSKRLGWRIVGCVFLSLATAMRYNALAATLPVVVMLFEWRVGLRWWKRYPIAIAVWIAITMTASATNRHLTKHPMHTELQCALHDIAGILHSGPPPSDASIEALLPGVLHQHQDIRKKIDHAYFPWSNYYLTFGDERIFDFPETEEQRATVSRVWFHLVTTRPWAYVRHRVRVAREILAVTKLGVPGPVWDGIPEDSDTIHYDIGFTITHSAWQSWWVHSLRDVGQSLLYRPWAYMLIALALLALRWRSRLEVALLLSGVFYEGTLFIAAVPDYRYSHWMVTCTVLAFVLAMIGRFRSGKVTRT